MARSYRPGSTTDEGARSLVLLIAALAVPPFLGPFPLSILMLIVIFAILAMSLDVLMGYTGMESLGSGRLLRDGCVHGRDPQHSL